MRTPSTLATAATTGAAAATARSIASATEACCEHSHPNAGWHAGLQFLNRRRGRCIAAFATSRKEATWWCVSTMEPSPFRRRASDHRAQSNPSPRSVRAAEQTDGPSSSEGTLSNNGARMRRALATKRLCKQLIYCSTNCRATPSHSLICSRPTNGQIYLEQCETLLAAVGRNVLTLDPDTMTTQPLEDSTNND